VKHPTSGGRQRVSKDSGTFDGQILFRGRKGEGGEVDQYFVICRK